MLEVVINGKQQSFDLDPNMPLLWVLRDYLRLTGTKYGCGVAQCGACTVLVDGAPRRSCVLPISAVKDTEVTTIEGLSGPQAKAVKAAWQNVDVPQCGYCQSGQIVSAVDLLRNTPNPTDEEIDKAMMGNICRCGTYPRIRQAIKNAANVLVLEE